MPTDLTVLTFFPDGAAPERTELAASQISDRWLSVCRDILNHHGPVFEHNMGSTLSHFDLHLAGPMGRLSVNGCACYELGISLGMGSRQDNETMEWFRGFLREACEVAKSTLSGDAISATNGLGAVPSVMLFDYCNPQIPDDQKAAMGQLGLHLVNAYFDCYTEGQQIDGEGLGSAGAPPSPSS